MAKVDGRDRVDGQDRADARVKADDLLVMATARKAAAIVRVVRQATAD